MRMTDLDRIDLEVQLLVFDQAVYSFGEHTLEITLSRSATRVGCHHAGDWGIGAQ